MIELSTAAKMKLAENRTTLFKADLILNGQYPSTVGKNLNDIPVGFENNYTGTMSSDTLYFNEQQYGLDAAAIPSVLYKKYKYLIVSHFLRLNSSTQAVPTISRMAVLFRKTTSGSLWLWHGEYVTIHPPIGEYVRCDCVVDLEGSDIAPYIDVIDYLNEVSVTFSESGATINLDYKNTMIELNNSGVPSRYADPYVRTGGSYDDFLTDREINLTGDDVMSGTATFSDSTSSSGSFDIGAAIINSMSLTLNNYDDRFAGIDFTGASVRAYIGVPIEPVEWITKGYYTVDKPTSIGNTIPLTMLDNMSKFEKPYSEVAQLYPATLAQILQSICLYCGVVLDSVTFPNSDFEISARPDDANITCLSMVSYVAQIAGCYARVNRFGYLQLKWYDPESFNAGDETYDGGKFDYAHTDNVLDGGKFDYAETGNVVDGGTFNYGEYYSCYAISSFSVGTDDIAITGIKVVVDSDNEIAVGADGYVLEISDNPLITADNMATVANYLGNKIVGLKFRPFNISALSEPAVEAGDAIRITDRKGNHYDSFITTCSYKYGNYEPFACNAQTVSENNAASYSPITKAVEKARKDTEKALTEYDKAVINMNEIAANALGYYTTNTEELDGSKITYMHDKPTLEESVIVYKRTISGFFLSQDGGETYTSGFDSSGNAVLNILYAIGIVCDWIKGGTLTLGGDNNVNGLARILDAGGGEVCRIDKDGLDVIAGRLGNIKINNNGLGSNNLGQSLSGLWLQDNGDFGFSKNTSTGSYASFFSTLASGNIHFYTGRGGDTVGEGLIVENISYGESQSSVMRVGSQAVERNYSEYAVFQSSSDRRLKKNINTIKHSLVRAFFNRLRIVKFNYKKKKLVDDKKVYCGVIAQEIEEVLQDIGFTNSNIVVTNEHGLLHVNYEKLHGFELDGIKDLYETVDRQQAEINELKAQVKYLMERVGEK